MAMRQTEACERGQVPALQKADQVAVPGMQGVMCVCFLLVTRWAESSPCKRIPRTQILAIL